MRSLPKLLSKTRIMKGYRCTKNLYLNIHQPDLEADITPEQQALFDQGNRVGEEARKFFPGGILVDNKPWDFFGSLKKTRELLAQKTEVIYEAAFEFKGCYARADIIKYSPDTQRWKIYEVKSSTKVKDEHLDDVGLQAWIIANSGLPLEEINLVHLNPACRFPNLENLFVAEDVTARLREKYPSILPKMNELFSSIRKDEVPKVDIGEHCLSPNECGFKEFCWKEKNIPEMSVFNLPKISARKWELYQQGIISIDDSRLTDLLPIQQRVVENFKTGKRFIDREAIKTAMAGWKFPLVYLDFETISPAIPRYLGTGPYMHVPFQFSVHVQEQLDEDLIHFEFLHDSSTDPRPTLIPALLKACEGEGSIVSYFGKFETDRINEMGKVFPEYNEALESLTQRIVDPLPVIRDHIYDGEFKGSFSLKAVAPALLGADQSYEGMMVANGGEAQRAYEEILNPNTTPERKNELLKASLEYCKKDTLVMVDLVKWLFEETK